MVLRRILGFFIPSLRQPMGCEACGENFLCDAGLTGCWCQEIKLGAPTRTNIRRQFRDCLCRKCLEGFARENAVVENAKQG